SGRIGGRLFTYKSPKKQEHTNTTVCPSHWRFHLPDVFMSVDVGAMRYPRTTFMKRTFDLVQNRLNMPKAFIPYIRANDNTFFCYNDITVTRAVNAETPKADNIFKASEANGGNVPQEYAAKGSSVLWDEGLKELRDNSKEKEFADAYEELMKYDEYSASQYLRRHRSHFILEHPTCC
ncbi:hypothetical protein B0H14DRAFT_2363187, partial [Mycena olivaceomarginata]